MARATLAVTPLVLNSATEMGSGATVVPADGIKVAADFKTSKLFLLVTHAATETAPGDLTIKAGVNPPSYQAAQGDYVIELDQETVLLALDSARFAQADGYIHVDCEDVEYGEEPHSHVAWTVYAFRLPAAL